MPLSFDTRVVSVGELLSGTNVFRLPSFQRPYSWPEEKVAQLFDDLTTAFSSWSGNGIDDGYFLGAVIVSRQGGNGAPYDLVDGQQRLAALSAIIAVLRDLLPNGPSKEQLQEHIVRPVNTLLALPEAPRFMLRDLENDRFGAWVHRPGGTAGLPNNADTEAEQNLLRGLHRVRTEFGMARPEYAAKLARFILNHGQFILITAGSLQDGYKLFRSVNTLGEPLTDIDLARAELLGAPCLSNAERERLREAWDAAEDEMGLDDLRAYVDTVVDLVAPDHAGRDLLTRLRSVFMRPEQVVPFRTKLGGFLNHFVNLKSGELEFGKDSAAINRLVRCLLALPDEDWLPIALLWLVQQRTVHETYRFFRALDGLMLSMMILGTTKSARAKRMKRIALGVQDGSVLSAASSDIYLKDSEVTRLKGILEGPIPANKKYLKPLLLRLNAEMTDPLCQPSFPAELTIEHVLPQRPSPKSVWLEKFPDPAKRKRLSELLGNYALLTQKMNPKGSNSEFLRKKSIYFDFRDHQNFALTAQLTTYGDWDERVIVDRQRELIGIAARVFNPLLAPGA